MPRLLCSASCSSAGFSYRYPVHETYACRSVLFSSSLSTRPAIVIFRVLTILNKACIPALLISTSLATLSCYGNTKRKTKTAKILGLSPSQRSHHTLYIYTVDRKIALLSPVHTGDKVDCRRFVADTVDFTTVWIFMSHVMIQSLVT